MEKTKLHIPATLLAALACLLAYYSGYLILGILVGYVLLVEDNAWLKKFSLKVLLLMLIFSVVNTVLYLLPDLIDILFSFLRIFGVYNRPDFFNFIDNVFNFLSQIISLLKMVVFLLLGAATLFGKDVKIPGLDTFVEKRIG